MNAYDTAAFIVLVVMLASVLKSFFKWLASRTAAAPPAAVDTGTLDVLRRLEERVKALETVVSDQGYELKEKFKELERH